MKIWQRAVAAAALASVSAHPEPPTGPAGAPHVDHVFVIMMENHGASQLLSPSNPNTRFIQAVAGEYGLATNYYGVTHVSLPNYIAAISGSNWGSNSDNPDQKTLLDHTNLVDQLEAHHVSWKAYMQSLPYAGYTATPAPSPTTRRRRTGPATPSTCSSTTPSFCSPTCTATRRGPTGSCPCAN